MSDDTLLSVALAAAEARDLADVLSTVVGYAPLGSVRLTPIEWMPAGCIAPDFESTAPGLAFRLDGPAAWDASAPFDWTAKARMALDLVDSGEDEAARLRIIERCMRWASGPRTDEMPRTQPASPEEPR